MKHALKLSLLPGRYSICRLAPTAAIPSWALKGPFSSLTRTGEELSLVCEERHVPAGIQAERARRLFRVNGPLAFSQTGVLASLVDPLAEAGVSVFAVSTFDTDYLLVSERDTQVAIAALEQAGHTIDGGESA